MKKISFFEKNLLIAIIFLLFTGCSTFNLGEPESSCEEIGCDYSDAGICGDLFENYKERNKNLDKAYENIHCKHCNNK